MKSAELENLVKTGHLSEEPPLPDEIRHSLERAANLLLDAKRAGTRDGRFSLAYDSAYAFARAALRRAGYRASARYMAFQCLIHTTDTSAQDWRVFDDAHRARNKIAYDGDSLETFSSLHTNLVETLLQATERLAECLRELEHGGDRVLPLRPRPPVRC